MTVPVHSIMLLCEAAACTEFCKGGWREEASRSWAASKTARVWSASSEAEKQEPECLCCRRRRRELKAQCWSLPLWGDVGFKAAAVVLRNASSWRNQYCWAWLLPSSTGRGHLPYQFHRGQIHQGALPACCLLKSLLCNCLALVIQLSREYGERLA